MATTSPITFIQGDDLSVNLVVTQQNGTAQNITGWTIYFTVKPTTALATSNDNEALISKAQSTHTNAVGGLSTISLTHTDTNIAAGSYIYDLRFVDGSGNVQSVQYGTCTIVNAVTRRVA